MTLTNLMRRTLLVKPIQRVALSAKVTEEEDDYEDADLLLPQKEDRHSQVHGGAMKRLQELRSSDAELL